jgi:acyl-coenzyme A synthetase/AMP-(fatty) acid ligase
LSADDIRTHCAATLAGFKVPKRVEFVSELPRTASGKLLRRELRG